MRRVCARLVLLFLLFPLSVLALGKGDAALLWSSNPSGVPVHPSDGESRYDRWANGTRVTIQDVGATTGWYKVASGGKTAWVTGTYLKPVAGDDPDPAEDGDEADSAVIGTWNVEYLDDTKTRGFPEYQTGGPKYPPRTAADYQAIAGVLRDDLHAAAMVLNEIHGTDDGASPELERLAGYLGPAWGWVIAKSGGSQHVAIVYDQDRVERRECEELTIPKQEVQGEDVFARDPLACRFALKSGGAARNDLVLVGVHLASGQQNGRNHDKAFEILVGRLKALLAAGRFGAGERDVLIAGDLNASRYDNVVESFWTGYDANGLKPVTLSPESGEESFPTRLGDVPLHPKSSIDYVLAAGWSGGILADLVQAQAEVHRELLTGGFERFREHLSDHVPVTVKVRVSKDDD